MGKHRYRPSVSEFPKAGAISVVGVLRDDHDDTIGSPVRALVTCDTPESLKAWARANRQCVPVGKRPGAFDEAWCVFQMGGN